MRRHPKFGALAAIAAGLLLAASPAAQAGEKVWISLGDAAFAQLKKHAPASIAVASTASAQSEPVTAKSGRVAGKVASKVETIHLVEVDEDLLAALSGSVHEELNRCGGFMYHPNKQAGLANLQSHAIVANRPSRVTRPSYVIDEQATLTPLLAQMQSSNIGQTILDLSAFTNRYYKTAGGVSASSWLTQRWTNIAAGRSDVTVEQFSHPNWAQKSVILTIRGSDNAREVVVLGAHLDSINKNGTTETTIAPGADDDASGVASLTEILRVLMNANYKPRRTLKFMAYAAEEVGLRGSQEIAQNYASFGVNVVGVMQLDMTNYMGSPKDIYIYTDYTDGGQNDFVTRLIQTYLPTLQIGSDKCGYACSDHASWNAQGFATSMPFEAAFTQDNPFIHTANDTYANSGNQAEHSLKFARMGLAYAVELGTDGPGTAPPPDKVESFKGSLALNENKSFGPFKVKAGGSLKASTVGTGDVDVYVKIGAPASSGSYDCKSDGGSSTESCSVNVAANGDVYVQLIGYKASSYRLDVSYRPQ
ncbi:M20/M25/M40 family metallo-hydrolase [Roseateles oligotrophus]|uniref:M20/M25/M40 family metallo-hydrolase n=1 Tax=Roseateles oligotrophus TaxID=1769250 RepID=A0ABT2YM69_9BURK|nr:M20/M25/M40 family metallo-hydrolase [Roseateles oligotrophus]MCV2371153.1 M20/M25/M40 family metallo-hydrolase [Roseateles oligotrophus]